MGANGSTPSFADQGYGTEPDVDAARRFVRGKPVANRRLRVLCLHGHGSTNAITEMQTTHLQLGKLHGVECDFLCAQLEVGANDAAIGMLSNGPYLSWFSWTTSEILGVAVGRGPGAAGGTLHDSLCRVLAHVAAHGPYDGVYGFSQGALMATLLSSETVCDTLPAHFRCNEQSIRRAGDPTVERGGI